VKKKNQKKKNKGFTLVELLASLVILGLLTLVAAPNILGILQSTKINTYIDDAKKLATLGEYKFRGDTNITKPTGSNCIVMTMKYLGTSEFKSAPNDGTYDETKSYVVVQKSGNSYKYYVQLVEVDEAKTKYTGIRTVEVKQLSTSNKTDYVGGGAVSELSEATAATTFFTDKNNTKICDGTIVKKYLE
jgi:prepilin-type N-terminal cleavage/methylation domain-containing protein